jgi:hypothetical protein
LLVLGLHLDADELLLLGVELAIVMQAEKQRGEVAGELTPVVAQQLAGLLHGDWENGGRRSCLRSYFRSRIRDC